MSLRLGVARDNGLDEDMAAKIDRYEASDLPERHKVALRLTDAFVTAPGAIGAELRAQARAHYTEAQLVELMLDMSKWSTQKLSVALGTDDPIDAERLSILNFDEAGAVVWGERLDDAYVPSPQPARRVVSG